MRRLVVFLALALAALSFGQAPSDSIPTPAKIRTGDEIVVTVAGFVSFSGDYVVSDDGMLTGVGFGSVQAEGKTLAEITDEVTTQLKKRLVDPEVELVLKKQTTQVIYVVGGQHSEPITYTPELDLRQIVGMAGLTDTPTMTDCVINRKGEPVRHIDLPKLLQGDPSQWDGPMQPNDVVTFIDKMFRVSVSGEVNEPGDYMVREDGQLIAAIAQAKGVTNFGTLKNVLVFRGQDVYDIDVSAAETGKPVSFPLEAGDSIVVRKSENAVYILGEVRMPGRYVIPDGKKLFASDVLALAQGLTPTGSLRRMALVRPGKDGKYQATSYNLDEFLKSGKAASNPELQSGDILLFNQPKAFQLVNLNQIASTAFLLNGIIK